MEAPAYQDYEQTPTVAALAEALASAQDEMENATKDSVNPHFKSKYADLAACREATKPIYKHGLSIVQQVISRPDAIGLRTVLLHKSGEWMASVMFVAPEKNGPQAAGSVITYLRRYMLCAMLGIAQEDDDANAGSMRPAGTPPPRAQTSSAPAPAAAPAAQAPDLPTADQMSTIEKLYGQLGMSKPAARAELQAVTGKESPFKMNRGDADKLIGHLKAKLGEGAQTGAAS